MSTFDIALDPTWEITAKVGTKLHYSSSLADISSAPPQTNTISLARILGFAPDKIFKYLRKSVGETVHKGETLAEYKTLFATKRYTADTDGLITHIDHVSGEIVYDELSGRESHSQILALVEGVVDHLSSDSLTLKVAKTLPVEMTASHPSRLGGPIVMTDGLQATLLTLPDVASAIVLAPDYTTYTIAKLEALQAQALITTTPLSTHIPHYIPSKSSDLAKIIDFGPTSMYADPSSSTFVFYR